MAELIRPTVEYKNSFIDAVKEFQAEGRNLDLDIKGLEMDFDAYLTHLDYYEKGINLPEGYVPQSKYWLVDENEFIGSVSVRHKLTEKLLLEGGHIGYEIRPSERKQGYGSQILKLVLPHARILGLDKVLLTCDDTNIGSAKIIEKNGGVLENRVEFGGKLKRRYWISIGSKHDI